jgi:predicted esterase
MSPLLALVLAVPLLQGGTPRAAPADAPRGKVHAWTSRDGIPFEFLVPASYDPEKGACLTVVLHGNGLDERWTFANHPAGKFRPDDIVVSPDGTTAHKGTGANEFLGEERDATRFRALLEELQGTWKVRQTFLYGHSQGSFFVFYYAGLHPGTIDGVLGHASGVWNWTRQGKEGRRLAIGLMHGTDDHIPYGQSWHGRKSYRDAGYPLVHLRTLFDWPHMPHWVQAAQVLAWCEGMTSDDPARVAACLETLCDPGAALGPDLAALHDVAARLAAMEGAPADARARGARAAKAVDELGARLVAQVEAGAGKKRPPPIAAEEWLGIAIRLVEELERVPSVESHLAGKGRWLQDVRKAAGDALGDYWRKKERDAAGAFDAGVELLGSGWLDASCPQVAAQLEAWLQRKDLKLNKRAAKLAEERIEAYRKGREKGFRAFVRACAQLETGR